MNRLPANTGWLWITQGFALFRKQPAVLTMLLFANLLVSLTVSAVPLVGPMLAMVLIPSFSIAVMQACALIGQGQTVTPGVLLTGFRQPAFRRLCKLGLIYLAIAVVLTLLMTLLVSPDLWKQLAAPIDARGKQTINASDLLTVMLIFLLQSVALMAMCFAAPLTYWQKMAPGKATFYSVFGVIGAIRPFMVMLLAWFGMFFGACILVTLLLGESKAGRIAIIWVMLQFMLLLQCAIFASYRQIFGDPALLAKDDTV